jgi:hypothetical protein
MENLETKYKELESKYKKTKRVNVFLLVYAILSIFIISILAIGFAKKTVSNIVKNAVPGINVTVNGTSVEVGGAGITVEVDSTSIKVGGTGVSVEVKE